MNRFIKQWLDDEMLEAVQRLRPVADDAGLTMSQLALAWILRQDNVASAIIGASRPEQVHENAAAAGVRARPTTRWRRSTTRSARWRSASTRTAAAS